jgi:nitrite reductase/ring-hydroxylating ferredoxin subunit/uncharacterized membrane protein
MKSRANIKSHPIHPMLVALPIGLWSGSLAFDLAAVASDDDERLRESSQDMMLGGLVGSLLAAAPGIIDYFAVVPPNSSAKQRAATHGLTNVAVTALYGVNYLVRSRSPKWGRRLGLPLSLIGFGGLLYAGWLGGTLVYRNQIGVDHRGPNATRWRETGALRGEPGTPVQVGTMEEFDTPGQMKLVHLNGHRIVVAREDDQIVAFQDHCTHKWAALSDGALACGVITCPWHGSQFNVQDGRIVSGPAEEQIRIYPVQVREGAIELFAPHPLPHPTIADRSGMLPPEPVRRNLETRAEEMLEAARASLPGEK